MQSIFITRHLVECPIFVEHLQRQGYWVLGESLIEFTPSPFVLKSKPDWLFFYSKKGVDYFFSQIQSNLLNNIRFAAIGPATANAIKQKGFSCVFIGDGNPSSTAENFLQVAANATVVFPQAAHSRRSIQELLQNDIQATSLVVYQNNKRKNILIPNTEVVVFTSPLNVEAFAANTALDKKYISVAIGKTTATHLKSQGMHCDFIAPSPDQKTLALAVEQAIIQSK